MGSGVSASDSNTNSQTHQTWSDVPCRIVVTKSVTNARLCKGIEHSVGQYRPLQYHSKCFYNTKYKPRDIESLLVRPRAQAVKVFMANNHNNTRDAYADIVKHGQFNGPKLVHTVGSDKQYMQTNKKMDVHVQANSRGEFIPKCTADPKTCDTWLSNNPSSTKQCDITSGFSSNTWVGGSTQNSYLGDPTDDKKQTNDVKGSRIDAHMGNKVFDITNAGHDKFLHAVLYASNTTTNDNPDCETFRQCRLQSKYDFGFVPLTDPVLPSVVTTSTLQVDTIGELHDTVKTYGCHNYMGARVPLKSQLNIDKWEEYLTDYWDKQLVEFLKFGFPMGFNRDCPLQHEVKNHSSAIVYPNDIQAYIEEEVSLGAIVGPFETNPIVNGHISPFMSRPKPNSDVRRVIVDLSWPKGASVNDGVDKPSYMGSEFSLTFPSIDHLTSELAKLGPGAHIYKIDVSRAFRHLKMDPFDFDLLGLSWNGVYIDTCLPFGARHGSQFFQRVSDTVRYIMRQRGFDVVNYIDDFLGFGTPSVAQASFDTLRGVMESLGLTISQKKLVRPATQAVCLGVLINTETGTISIPEDKLRDVRSMVDAWSAKKHCTKRQLQSLLGSLLYIHKCVKPARCFLNRVLNVLRQAPDSKRIILTPEFHRDIRWFQKFPPCIMVFQCMHTKTLTTR